MSDNDEMRCKTVRNKLFKKQRALLAKARNAEAPSGAAMPKAPSPPKPPVGPVASGKNPQGQAAKQAQTAAKGASTAPKGPKQPKMPQMAQAPKAPKMGKSELKLSESELYTDCEHCGTPQFKKTEHGPQYDPCACFLVTKSEKFVTLKKSDRGYELQFNENADPESVKAFLLALKARLLVAKKFGDQ